MTAECAEFESFYRLMQFAWPILFDVPFSEVPASRTETATGVEAALIRAYLERAGEAAAAGCDLGEITERVKGR